jgi:two-component system nitrate/nitrite response regulator NarL
MPKRSRPLHTIRVALADASRMKSQLMVTALQRIRHRIAVVGSVVDSSGLCQLLEESRAHVAVIGSDLKDGPVSGFEAVKRVRSSCPSVRSIMILDSCVPTMVVEAFRAGTHGVLSRDDSFEVLCKCIHAVHEGQVWANSKQLHFILEALAKSAPSQISSTAGTRLLTQREEGLVQLVSQGLTNREISKELKLSEHTVRNYLFRIFNKLGTSNRLELALYKIHRTGSAPILPADHSESAASNDVRHHDVHRQQLPSASPLSGEQKHGNPKRYR